MSEGKADDPPATAGIWSTIIRWLSQQRPEVVVLSGILIAICYGGYQAASFYIPMHLERIDRGYKTISDENAKVQKEITDRCNSTIENVVKQHSESLDTQAKHFESTVKTLTEAQDRERQIFRDWIRDRSRPASAGSPDPENGT